MKTAIISISMLGIISAIGLGLSTIAEHRQADNSVACTPSEQPDEKSETSPRKT